MISRFCTVIGLPLAAALTIVMCGSARSSAAGTVPQQNVAADGSRRILSAPKLAPTAVGGYRGVTYQGLPPLRIRPLARRTQTRSRLRW